MSQREDEKNADIFANLMECFDKIAELPDLGAWSKYLIQLDILDCALGLISTAEQRSEWSKRHEKAHEQVCKPLRTGKDFSR